MAELLPANKHGFESAEQCFPESRQRCDVIIDVGKPKPFWVEVKGAWRAKFDPPAPNSSYFKHLYAAAEDVDKLLTLTSEYASGVAMVLVGFDQTDRPITDEHLEMIRAKTCGDCWCGGYTQWDVQGRIRFRTRCWVWSRWV